MLRRDLRYICFALSVKYSFLLADEKHCHKSAQGEDHNRDPKSDMAVVAGLRRSGAAVLCLGQSSFSVSQLLQGFSRNLCHNGDKLLFFK